MMFKKDGIGKRLKKISKHEAASVKLLEQQESDLVKAVEENQILLQKNLTKKTKREVKITSDIEKLTKRIEELNCNLELV